MAKKDDIILIIAKSFSKDPLTSEECNLSCEFTLSELITEYGLNDIQASQVINWCVISNRKLQAKKSEVLEEGLFDSFRTQNSLKNKKAKQALSLLDNEVDMLVGGNTTNSILFMLVERLNKLFRYAGDEQSLGKFGLKNLGGLRMNRGSNVKRVLDSYNTLIENIIQKLELAKEHRNVKESIRESLSPEVRLAGLDLIFDKTREFDRISQVESLINEKGLIGEVNKFYKAIRRSLYNQIRDTSARNSRKDKDASIEAIYHIELEIKSAICDKLIELYEDTHKNFKAMFSTAFSDLESIEAILSAKDKKDQSYQLEPEELPFKSAVASRKGHDIDPERRQGSYPKINRNY